MSDDPPFQEASIYIEQQEGTNKFKIQSGQLEQIGAQLRGRRTFPIFFSIILPFFVSVATVVFSSLFQYVSWFNSVSVKDATDVADRANRVYENSAAAIGTRHYATFVFVPSLQALVADKARAHTLSAQVLAQGKEAKARDIVYTPANAKNRNFDIDRFLRSSTEGTKDNPQILLHRYDLEVKNKRFASYYEQLKLWNENYDRQLSDIEYALDRPVFEQADKNVSFRVSRRIFEKINCLNPLSEELQNLNLNPHSLKFRFAGINNCFMEVHYNLDQQLEDAKQKDSPTFSEKTKGDIKKQLEHLLAMANEFRCYAHRRIDYYNHQKELAIFGTTYIWRVLTDATKTDALKHFEDTAVGCAQRTDDVAAPNAAPAT